MNKLQEIFESKKIEVAQAQLRTSIAELERMVADLPKTQGFLASLEASPHPVALIAEVKRASPSAGIIRENFDPAQIASAYKRAGADCLSVLTDEKYFGGHAQNIELCKTASCLPALRKDFLFHPYQVYESRALGADAILLIVAMLDFKQIQDLHDLAITVGLDVLVEVHTEKEAETALKIGAKLIGINNRDLGTFKTDLKMTEQIAPILCGKAFVVSESALAKFEDIQRVEQADAQAVLIGTAFCSAEDIESKVREVMNWQ